MNEDPEQSYGGLGIPVIFPGGFAALIGIVLITFAFQVGWSDDTTWVSTGMVAVGLLAAAFGVLHILHTPTRLRVRSNEIGFTLVNGKTEWFPKLALRARIGRYASTSRGFWVLRFDTPGKRRLVPLAYDPTILMTDDGRMIEPKDLERVLGMSVERPTASP